MKHARPNVLSAMKRLLLVLAAVFTPLFFSAYLTSCYGWLQAKVPMEGGGKKTDLSGLFEYRDEKIVLEPPAQVFASRGIHSGKIEVRWSEVQHASSYVLERAVSRMDSDGKYSVPDEEEFEVVSKFVYGTKYVDTVLENPGSADVEYSYRYYYRVSAENMGSGHASSDFTDVNKTETEGCGYLYAAPKDAVAWKGKSVSEIQLTWNASPDTHSYNIYRGENVLGSGMELVSTVPATRTVYSDEISSSEQGREFFYRVSAVNSYGYESAKSTIAMGYSLKEGAPACPENVRVEDGFAASTTSLCIKWDEVSPEPGKTVFYNVYRSNSESSVVSLVKARINATSYTDKSNLKKSVFYYYYVMAISVDDSTGEEMKSGFSETGPESESPAFGFLLSPPTVMEVSEDGVSSGENVRLKWKGALGCGLVENPFVYNVYYSNTLTGAFTLIMQNVESTADADGFICVEIKKYNYYRISTVNFQNLESDLGAVAAPHPGEPRNVKACRNVILDSAWKPNANGVYPVKITWDAPENEQPSAYTVYRSSSAATGFKKVSTVYDTFCVDENPSARAGVMYYYKVVSLNIQNQGSHSNSPETDADFQCRGYGAITRDQWFREYNKTVKNSLSKLTLMYKSNDMDKLGSETVRGDLSGTLSYTSKIAGLGAEIKMPYTNYADFYCGENGRLYIGSANSYAGAGAYSKLSDEEKKRAVLYFVLNGSTDTSCNMSANGYMSNSVVCSGMYPGKAVYDNLKIVGGSAGGGYYIVTTYALDGTTLLDADRVDWSVGEEVPEYNLGG